MREKIRQRDTETERVRQTETKRQSETGVSSVHSFILLFPVLFYIKIKAAWISESYDLNMNH